VSDNVYVVMELVDGWDLIDYLFNITRELERNPKELQKQRLWLFKEVVRFGIHALPKLHRAGIAHGDLRLENIRLSKRGKLYLLDLGSACFRSASGGVGDAPTEPVCPRGADRSQRQAYGDPALYLKTEEGTATFEDWAQADWWALGLVLFYVLTGVHPYDTLGGWPGSAPLFLLHRSDVIKDSSTPRKYVFDMLTPEFRTKGVLDLESLIMLTPYEERTDEWKKHIKAIIDSLT